MHHGPRRRCARRWRAPKSATTCSATTRRVNALQERIAALLGFEAALFVPSGTQSNLVAIMSHCQRGDEYIVGQMAHTYRWEGGGAAVLGSVQPQPLAHQADGTLALADIEAAIKPDDAHFARSRLLVPGEHARRQGAAAAPTCATRRRSRAGAVWRRTSTARGCSTPRRRSAACRAREIAQHFDSVSVCFSKGLGAPVGSALCGSREFIARAHRWRKMAGGGMRQAGVLAAAALYALEHHVERLAEDHANARRLAEGLAGAAGVTVEAPQTRTSCSSTSPATAPPGLLEHLKARGVLATGLYRLRFVTHSTSMPRASTAPSPRCANT